MSSVCTELTTKLDESPQSPVVFCCSQEKKGKMSLMGSESPTVVKKWQK